MLKGTSILDNEEYISERDPAKTREDGATIFHLSTIPVQLRTQLQDQVMGMTDLQGQGFVMNVNQQFLQAVRFGLKNTENFADKNGKTLPFASEEINFKGKDYTVPTMEFLAHFPTWLIVELGKEIMGVNSVTDTERKK